VARPVLAVLTLLLALAAPVQAQTTADTRAISVEGDASRQVPNDTARFTTAVSAQRRTARGALGASAKTTRRVLASLAALGVERADTRTSSVTLRRVFERDRRTRRLRLVGYRARSGVRVTIRDLAQVGQAIDAVVGAGAGDVGSVTFFVSDSEAIYREVLAEAFDDALAKAQLLAARAGLTLGPARAISEGTDEELFTLEGRQRLAGADSPSAETTPVRPGRTRVKAVVSVLFDASVP
jgi:uncharacterized protein